MDDKKQSLSEQAEESAAITEPSHALEDDLLLTEVLRTNIRLLENKEKVLTQKLCIAKDKGMHEQADRCRVLLQRVVLQRNRRLAQLKEAEERIRKARALAFMERFAKEVDELTGEVEEDLLGADALTGSPDTAPLIEEENERRAKSKRLSFIASAFVWVGILSGLIGALVYMLLVEFRYIVFTWSALSVFGMLMLTMIVIALCFGAASNRQKKYAKELSDQITELRAQYEEECRKRRYLLQKTKMISQLRDADGIREAYEIEKAGDQQREIQKNIREWIPDLSDAERVKKGLLTAASITAACTGVVVALAIRKHKKTEQRFAEKEHELEAFRTLFERLS
ncbi:MAG: hypothetical protein E7637_01115 [Ruminococcaceae bacterium]|nr:hypothetical protein [Oscillospiraceae bacterium]